MLEESDKLVSLPSHGENRGSSPLGSASEIKYLARKTLLVSNGCLINGCEQPCTRTEIPRGGGDPEFQMKVHTQGAA